MIQSVDREAESALIEQVDIDRVVGHVDALADLRRHPGTDDERQAAEYVVDQLRAYGVDVEAGEYEGYVSEPTDAGLTVTRPTNWAVPDEEIITVAFGGATPPAGVHGEVVSVPEVTPETLASLDLDGRIAFTRGLPTPEPVEALAAAGASAAVFESPTPGHCHEMSAAEDLTVELNNRLVPALYERGPNHRHDPAVEQCRLPGIAAVGDPDERTGRARLFAETSLRREVARVAELLRESRAAAEQFCDAYDE